MLDGPRCVDWRIYDSAAGKARPAVRKCGTYWLAPRLTFPITHNRYRLEDGDVGLEGWGCWVGGKQIKIWGKGYLHIDVSALGLTQS